MHEHEQPMIVSASLDRADITLVCNICLVANRSCSSYVDLFAAKHILHTSVISAQSRDTS